MAEINRVAFLERDEDGLKLTNGKIALRADFSSLKRRIRAGNVSSELVVKAAKIKGIVRPLRIVDATAGLGEDSFLLAAAGNEVLMFEYDETVAALLSDALERAGNDPELREIVSRMSLTPSDSVKGMKDLSYKPDVILLDPMFPERTKSAEVKKKFQLIHLLEKPCDDEGSLLDAAITAKPAKIIIKRPLKGPFLAGKEPDYSLSGKAIRFDVLLFPDNFK